MYFLLNLNHYVKSYGHLSQILAFFTMPALQIWPCHMTQEANFKKKLFFPNSAFNIGKSCNISSRKALYFRSYQPKTSQGVENTPPPVLLGLRTNSIKHSIDTVAKLLDILSVDAKSLPRGNTGSAMIRWPCRCTGRFAESTGYNVLTSGMTINHWQSQRTEKFELAGI